MKRILSVLIVFLFVGVSLAQAQMINYERRNRSVQTQQISQPQTTAASSRSDRYARYTSQKTAEEAVQALPSVTNRFEQSYDDNKDGKLQKSEVQDLYQYVISTIARRGSVRVSSDVLKPFDTNEDGVINRNEVRNLKKALN